jgi:2-oxoglutarate dehydrogenase E1 component
MGAWSHMLQRLELVKLECASRPYAAVPAPGSSTRDKRRQRRVIDSIFTTI